jgi:hypothetical protein
MATQEQTDAARATVGRAFPPHDLRKLQKRIQNEEIGFVSQNPQTDPKRAS